MTQQEAERMKKRSRKARQTNSTLEVARFSVGGVTA